MTARYEVLIVRPQDGRTKTFSTHDTREVAEVEAAKLRRHGFDVQVHRIDAAADEAPEFGSSRRKFLIAMFMCGAIPPERVVDRIRSELEQEQEAAP